MGKLKPFLVIAATVGLAAACDQAGPVTAPDDGAFAAAVSIPTTGLNEAVWVCKDAPSGTFDFTVTGNITQPAPGNTMNIIDAAPSIAAGSCVKVGDAGNGNEITVSENTPPAGYVFDRIEVFYVPFNTNNVVPDPTTPVLYTPTVTRPYGDTGRLFVFYNVQPPSTGCTLTQGYWKTHSEYGPAPYDATWASLAGGADSPVFLSSQSWYEVFHTAPKGNAYYNLAHQYMAAKLNVLAGADPSAVSSALASAEALFGAYTPGDIAPLKGNDSLRKQFVDLASTLDDYNNGLTGPGHCGGDFGPID